MATKIHFDIVGVIAPVFTPFDGHGNLNLSVIPGYMEYLYKHGICGILVGGTTGEALNLSLEERKKVLDTWLIAAKPLGTKIIVQVGGVPLPEVLDMAKYAEEMSVDAILTLPELYYKPKTAEQLVSYLADVSGAAPALPLLYYHFPAMSGINVNIPEFFAMATSRIANFKGMKADLEAAIQVADLLQTDQRIFIANHFIAPAVLLGHVSSSATVANLFPGLMMAIIEATEQGNVQTVRTLQGKLNRLVNAISSNGDFLPAMKAAMPLVSRIEVGPPRRPLDALDDQRTDIIRQILHSLID